MSNNNTINNKTNIMSSNIGIPTQIMTRTESPISSYLNDKYNTIIGTLISTASTSEINQQLGACVAKGKHPLSRSCPNREGTFCGNQMCGSLHAEANAITKVARSYNSSDGATLYVTSSPCIECAKLIIQSGILRVVYCNEYRTTFGLDLLRQAKIELLYIPENQISNVI